MWTTKLGAVNAWNRRCDNAKWRNARMETPDGLIEVLACIYYQGVPKIEKVYWSIDHWVLMEGGEVTHWMPLPPFPEEVFMKEESDE